jgi:hypothetical protein
LPPPTLPPIAVAPRPDWRCSTPAAICRWRYRPRGRLARRRGLRLVRLSGRGAASGPRPSEPGVLERSGASVYSLQALHTEGHAHERRYRRRPAERGHGGVGIIAEEGDGRRSIASSRATVPPAGREIAGIAPKRGEPPADNRLAERFGILDQLLSSVCIDRSG